MRKFSVKEAADGDWRFEAVLAICGCWGVVAYLKMTPT